MLSGRVIPGPLAGGHQRLQIGRHLDLSAVPRLYPAFGSFKPVAAGTEAAPAVVTQDEFHTIGITAIDGIAADQAVAPENAAFGFVLDRLGVFHVRGPLSHGDGVRRPLQQTGMEIPELAAATVRVSGIGGRARAGARPDGAYLWSDVSQARNTRIAPRMMMGAIMAAARLRRACRGCGASGSSVWRRRSK